jgi:hypothetical protein
MLFLPGLVVLFMGVALVIVYILTRPTRNGEPSHVAEEFEDVPDMSSEGLAAGELNQR